MAEAAPAPQRYKDMTQPERAALRALYVTAQDGLCHHCGTRLDGPPAPAISEKPSNWKLFPPNFTRYPVHLHHSHKTDLTIGAVHSLCNAVLWQYHGE